MLIAIVLSFLVFFVWSYFFSEKPDAEKSAQAPPTEETVAGDPPPSTYEPEKRAVQTLKKTQPREPVLDIDVITVTSPLYTVKISEHRAAFKSYVLHDYREAVDMDADLKELIPAESEDGTVLLGFADRASPNLSDAIFQADISSDTLSISDNIKSLVFTWTSPEGIIVEKIFSFSPDSYYIDMVINIKNGSEGVLEDNLTLSLISQNTEKKSRYGFEGPCTLIDKTFEKIEVDDIEEKNKVQGLLKWIAIQDRYFISSIIPKNIEEAWMILSLDPDKGLEAKYSLPLSGLQPNTQQRYEYTLYFGPKSVNILKSCNCELDKAINFGWFDIIAKPCLWLMNFFYSYVPNYGVAIILLTVLVKLLFWPLGSKSYKSMNEMKKLQPLMAEIREKYKDDKKRMNEEVMGLYKTYKVNPLGGCLPMVAQIPVFFALYQMLYGAIELRHAPFFGWINDLAAPDRLFNFGFSIPFVEPPTGIPVLTIVMGATMLIQQKLQPPMGDPTQAKMMMFMPIIFTVIFVNFSSGLVLYWLINNVLSIAQQYYISKANA